MNKFGGDWTKAKIEILVDYAKAYLQIMNKRAYFKLIYFDGFAGSGFIEKEKITGVEQTIGAAIRIIEIDQPRPFDVYYFVEKDMVNFRLLKASTKDKFPDKEIHVVQDDCNKKMLDLANYLRGPGNKNIRTLAFIDPCGMQVEWRSIENLRGLDIDMWILVPTGLGLNRLLTKSGEISDAWFKRLELFLGLTKEEIGKRFYRKTPSLFEDVTLFEKEKDAIQKSAALYQSRLQEVFTYVSEPYELKNSGNTIMYHLFLTSNNKFGAKIASEIVRKYNQQ
jgi:three-Cys-motif partner protein